MRRPEGFNLAFLDILACGLGAVILILVLLKNQERLAGNETGHDNVQVSSIEQDISTLTREIDRLKTAISDQSVDGSRNLNNTALLLSQLQSAKDEAQSKAEELSKLQVSFESIDKR